MDVHVNWSELTSLFRDAAVAAVEDTVDRNAPHFRMAVEFAAGRLNEGREVGGWLLGELKRPLRILDIGAGNGGVAHGAGNFKDIDLHAIDIVPNPAFREYRRRLDADLVTQTVGSGHAIPFRDDTFDVVLCLETLEHIEDPQSLGREIMRVLKPGAMCMVMTPARVKYLFRADPHFGIRGLLLLPDGLQKLLVARLLRRTRDYDVVHTFWSLRGIASLFPGHREVEPLFNKPLPPGTVWYTFRRWLWDRVLIWK